MEDTKEEVIKEKRGKGRPIIHSRDIDVRINGVLTTPKFTPEQELEIFKQLAYKTYTEVGYLYGLDKVFSGNDVLVRNEVRNIANKIRRAPELWGISKDAVDVVDEAVKSRIGFRRQQTIQEHNIKNDVFKDRLQEMRDKVADMIMKKLKYYGKSKETLEGVNLRDLKDLLAVSIDKSRVLRDDNPENITKLAKINVDNMRPEDALAVVMKAREAMLEGTK